MNQATPTPRLRRWLGLLLLGLLVAAWQPTAAPVTAAVASPGGAAIAAQVAPPAVAAEPSLIVYSSVERLLGGDLDNTIAVADAQTDLARFPSDWPVVGVGTTNWIDRNGELMPDGTAGATRFWWADPGSPSQSDVKNLADPSVIAALGQDPRLPFVALAVGNPATATTWTMQNVDDVYDWLGQKLVEAGITLAGIQLQGQFGPVKTTVAYDIPSASGDTGDSSGVKNHTFDYPAATSTLNGLYAGDPAMQPVISTPGQPLHFHGYQPGAMRGGHITSAAAVNVTATVWPLTQTTSARHPTADPPSSAHSDPPRNANDLADLVASTSSR
jgi:hypothetical protein